MLQRGSVPLAGVLVAVALVGALVLSTWDHDDSRATAAEPDTTRTINVNGEGRVSLTPDVAILNLGVMTRDPQLATAQQSTTEAMNAVRQALIDAGVKTEDIQTSTYAVNVEQDYNQPNQPIIGYYVIQTVSAKVRQIDTAGDVIQAAVDAGANQVNGISFTLEDTSAAINKARELAVADARERAEHLAELSNATLGPVQTITEGYTTPVSPVREGAFAAAEDSAAGAPTIDAGTMEVTVSVSVTYVMQ
ncbi:MAG: SIMPL domain-containing protein [Thermomicrobiales bacterium]|nr:SIMPL domain-containing protein [Thermomicrobiales bacterium]